MYQCHSGSHSSTANNGPMEGSPAHAAGKASLRRYWKSFGFQQAHGDYLV